MNQKSNTNCKIQEQIEPSKNIKRVSKSKATPMSPLPSDFSPGPTDVICARGANAYCHSGNRRLRTIIRANLENYSNSKSKSEKSVIVSSIINSIRGVSPQGGFVRKESGTWYEVGDHVAREKVGQSLRDSLHTLYRSSSKAKKRRLKEQKAIAENAQDTHIPSEIIADNQLIQLHSKEYLASSSKTSGALFPATSYMHQEEDRLLEGLNNMQKVEISPPYYARPPMGVEGFPSYYEAPRPRMGEVQFFNQQNPYQLSFPRQSQLSTRELSETNPYGELSPGRNGFFISLWRDEQEREETKSG